MRYNQELSRIIADLAETAGHLWEKGWAERNGGNISCDVTEVVDRHLKNLPPCSDLFSIGRRLEHIGGGYFLVTGTNRRMRHIAKDPMGNTSLVRLDPGGEHYQIVAEQVVRPTSEMSSHLVIHNFLRGGGSNCRAIVHTHPTDLVAMTHNPAFLEKDVLTELLWSMIPETRAFCPKGVGIVPYALPGSFRLADATLERLKEYDVVLWEKHGALAVGENIVEAFDMIDTLSKSARIYLIARSMGFAPTGMTSVQMQELADSLGR